MTPSDATSMTEVILCRMRYRYGGWTKGKGLFGQAATKVLKEQWRGTPKIQFEQSPGIPFLYMYTDKRACVISLCCGYASKVCESSGHKRSIPDHKHGARNTCLYERIFIQFLRRTKDEDTQLCQQSLHAGCPNDYLPLLTRNVQNNLPTSSSRQAAWSIPRVCSTSRLVPLAGIKSII